MRCAEGSYIIKYIKWFLALGNSINYMKIICHNEIHSLLKFHKGFLLIRAWLFVITRFSKIYLKIANFPKHQNLIFFICIRDIYKCKLIHLCHHLKYFWNSTCLYKTWYKFWIEYMTGWYQEVSRDPQNLLKLIALQN